ncbi:MAG: 23S rRNA (guanosine(2251)-2'-O)-methyltransferase RlmB [Thermoanaerobaculia bacterium]
MSRNLSCRRRHVILTGVLIYGFHPVREALRSRPQDVCRVLLSVRIQKARGAEIGSLAATHSIKVDFLPTERLDELASGAVHNGFAAELRRSAGANAGSDPNLVVLLEDVQDPRNLGAILRVCEGAGVGRVLIRDRGSAPLSAATIKTSAGAVEHLAIDRITNSAREIEALKQDGFWIYGAEGAGESVWDVDLTGKVCICLGGEEKGLRSRTRKLCDRLVALPMRGRVESLNVSTASAALLYEAVRQRR